MRLKESKQKLHVNWIPVLFCLLSWTSVQERKLYKNTSRLVQSLRDVNDLPYLQGKRYSRWSVKYYDWIIQVNTIRRCGNKPYD